MVRSFSHTQAQAGRMGFLAGTWNGGLTAPERGAGCRGTGVGHVCTVSWHPLPGPAASPRPSVSGAANGSMGSSESSACEADAASHVPSLLPPFHVRCRHTRQQRLLESTDGWLVRCSNCSQCDILSCAAVPGQGTSYAWRPLAAGGRDTPAGQAAPPFMLCPVDSAAAFLLSRACPGCCTRLASQFCAAAMQVHRGSPGLAAAAAAGGKFAAPARIKPRHRRTQVIITNTHSHKQATNQPSDSQPARWAGRDPASGRSRPSWGVCCILASK